MLTDRTSSKSELIQAIEINAIETAKKLIEKAKYLLTADVLVLAAELSKKFGNEMIELLVDRSDLMTRALAVQQAEIKKKTENGKEAKESKVTAPDITGFFYTLVEKKLIRITGDSNFLAEVLAGTIELITDKPADSLEHPANVFRASLNQLVELSHNNPEINEHIFLLWLHKLNDQMIMPVTKSLAELDRQPAYTFSLMDEVKEHKNTTRDSLSLDESDDEPEQKSNVLPALPFVTRQATVKEMEILANAIDDIHFLNTRFLKKKAESVTSESKEAAAENKQQAEKRAELKAESRAGRAYKPKDAKDLLEYKGNTPLHVLAVSSNTEGLEKELAINSIYINTVNVGGYTPLHCAIITGQLENVKMLLKHKADWQTVIAKGEHAGFYPLHLAAYFGQLAILKFLTIESKIEINVKQKTPEYRVWDVDPCVYPGFNVLHIAVVANQRAVVEFLHQQLKFDLDVRTADRVQHSVLSGETKEEYALYTPLHVAALFNCLETARYLLENGANPNIAVQQATFVMEPFSFGYMTPASYSTPLYLAAREADKCPEDVPLYKDIIKLFIAFKADRDIKLVGEAAILGMKFSRKLISYLKTDLDRRIELIWLHGDLLQDIFNARVRLAEGERVVLKPKESEYVGFTGPIPPAKPERLTHYLANQIKMLLTFLTDNRDILRSYVSILGEKIFQPVPTETLSHQPEVRILNEDEKAKLIQLMQNLQLMNYAFFSQNQKSAHRDKTQLITIESVGGLELKAAAPTAKIEEVKAVPPAAAVSISSAGTGAGSGSVAASGVGMFSAGAQNSAGDSSSKRKQAPVSDDTGEPAAKRIKT